LPGNRLLLVSGESVKTLAKQLKVKDTATFYRQFASANPGLHLKNPDQKIPAETQVVIPNKYTQNFDSFESAANNATNAKHYNPGKASDTGAVGASTYVSGSGPSVAFGNTNAQGYQTGYTQVGSTAPITSGVPATSAQVTSWIDQALQLMGIDPNSPQGQEMVKALKIIIAHESGGNPNSINNWDSNAKAGHPSQGLMQTIPGTFTSAMQTALQKFPGIAQKFPNAASVSNITNPVLNIIAGAVYAEGRYGSLGNVPGVKAVNSGGAYVGY
jgi:hypothetical protein